MAYAEIQATDNLEAGRLKINTNLRDTSLTYPTKTSLNVHPIEIEGNGCEPLELVNIGNPGFVPQGTESRNLVPAGVLRIGGNSILFRNMEWDQANLKWLTPFQAADAYGSSCFEAGGEAAILHATPAGVDFTDVPHEIFLGSANGVNGVPGLSTGYYCQAKGTIFGWYSSSAYDPGATDNSWNPSTSAQPVLHLGANEGKGTDNELARFEINSNTSTAYPACHFAKSRGTNQTKTIAVTGEVSGRLGWKVYDGDEYHMTAFIDAVTRGTMANNAVGQELRFGTSATNTASIAVRMALGHDGGIKAYTPIRYDVTSITTIPTLTSLISSPSLTTGSVGQITHLSTGTGGLRVFGFSTTSTAATARALLFTGILGATAPTAPAMAFQAMKHDGSTSATDIAAGEIAFHVLNNQTIIHEMLGDGRTGFGATGPTALVHCGASTTGRAGLRVVPGPAPNSPNNGDIWIDSTAHTIHVRINGVTKTFTLT